MKFYLQLVAFFAIILSLSFVLSGESFSILLLGVLIGGYWVKQISGEDKHD